MEERELRIWLKKVLAALHFMHENNMAHKDIKPENIFLFYDAQQQPKLHSKKTASKKTSRLQQDVQEISQALVPNSTVILKLGDMQAAAAFNDPAPVPVTAYTCSPELARHVRSEWSTRRVEGTALASQQLLPEAGKTLEACSTGDDLHVPSTQ